MTTAHRQTAFLRKGTNDEIIDQLRACRTSSEILEFEAWFNSKSTAAPLYSVICELLRNRDITRSTASKWLEILFEDRENKIKKKL